MEEENKPKRHYKIEVGDIVTIKKQTYGDYTFYKVSLPKKNVDETITYYDKNIAFNSGVSFEDGDRIKVLDFFEDVFVRKNDKFNANWTIHITEFEVVSSKATVNNLDAYTPTYDQVMQYSGNVENIESPF